MATLDMLLPDGYLQSEKPYGSALPESKGILRDYCVDCVNAVDCELNRNLLRGMEPDSNASFWAADFITVLTPAQYLEGRSEVRMQKVFCGQYQNPQLSASTVFCDGVVRLVDIVRRDMEEDLACADPVTHY